MVTQWDIKQRKLYCFKLPPLLDVHPCQLAHWAWKNELLRILQTSSDCRLEMWTGTLRISGHPQHIANIHGIHETISRESFLNLHKIEQYLTQYMCILDKYQYGGSDWITWTPTVLMGSRKALSEWRLVICMSFSSSSSEMHDLTLCSKAWGWGGPRQTFKAECKPSVTYRDETLLWLHFSKGKRSRVIIFKYLSAIKGNTSISVTSVLSLLGYINSETLQKHLHSLPVPALQLQQNH